MHCLKQRNKELLGTLKVAYVIANPKIKDWSKLLEINRANSSIKPLAEHYDILYFLKSFMHISFDKRVRFFS